MAPDRNGRHTIRKGVPVLTDHAPTFSTLFREELGTLLRWRRDVRHFQSTPLADGEMEVLLESACLAPSVGNSQPWRFVRLQTPGLREQLAAHVDAQSLLAAQRYTDEEQKQRYLALKLHGLREAPEILAVFSDEHPAAGHGLGVATMPEMFRYSTVMAIELMWLAARARGIGLGWVSILDPATVTRMLSVPEDWTLIALLCVGYPLEQSEHPELERRGWQERTPWTDAIFSR